MHRGTVKWFNNKKGFGFILSPDHDEDLFAHYSSIFVEGYKNLKAGQYVEFEVATGLGGIQAVNIRPIEKVWQ